jgi:tripartite ATP-independent transporter DctP family solute receptor
MKKIKRLIAVAVCTVMALSLVACGSSDSSSTSTTSTGSSDGTEQTFNMKLAHNLAEDHAVHIALTAWAEAVKEASNGTINIEIVPNGTLGSESDCIASIQAGGLEMTKVSASTLGNFKEEWNALSVPYVFNDKDHYYSVMDGEIAQDLYDLTADDGFIGLTWLDSGSRSFYTANTPIRTPSDLKGLKIRTMDSQMAIDMMTALGGSATVMSYSEIYTGMQQGVIDGAENNVTALRDHGDVAKYYCFDEHTRIPDVVVISSKVWNSMSENQQNIMKTTAADMTESYKSAWAAFEDEVLESATANGVELIRDVDTAAFQEACQSIYDNLKTSSPSVYSIVEKIQNAA